LGVSRPGQQSGQHRGEENSHGSSRREQSISSLRNFGATAFVLRLAEPDLPERAKAGRRREIRTPDPLGVNEML
jgi:hypothetical protein